VLAGRPAPVIWYFPERAARIPPGRVRCRGGVERAAADTTLSVGDGLGTDAEVAVLPAVQLKPRRDVRQPAPPAAPADDGATLTGLSQAQINLGLIDLATGTRGGDAEQVLVFGGHPTAPVCAQTPALCTPAGVASEIPDQDPGTRASASGHILRITGTIATFRKDGLPV